MASLLKPVEAMGCHLVACEQICLVDTQILHKCHTNQLYTIASTIAVLVSLFTSPHNGSAQVFVFARPNRALTRSFRYPSDPFRSQATSCLAERDRHGGWAMASQPLHQPSVREYKWVI